MPEENVEFIVVRVTDFETTGIFEDGKPDPEVIEYGFHDVGVRKDDNTTSTFVGSDQAYVKSEAEVSVKARATHHIPQSVIDDAECTQELYPLILLGDETVSSFSKPDIFCAHNAQFEQRFFNPEGSYWICTFKCARRIWPDFEQHTNQYLRYKLGLDERAGFDTAQAMPPHAALPDTYVTSWILMEMLKEHTLRDLISMTRKPLYFPVVPFGKHYGKKWHEVDTGYLDWVLKNITDNPDLIAFVRELRATR